MPFEKKREIVAQANLLVQSLRQSEHFVGVPNEMRVSERKGKNGRLVWLVMLEGYRWNGEKGQRGKDLSHSGA